MGKSLAAYITEHWKHIGRLPEAKKLESDIRIFLEDETVLPSVGWAWNDGPGIRVQGALGERVGALLTVGDRLPGYNCHDIA